MKLKKTISQDGKVIKIAIGERFDFDIHCEFRDSYEGTGLQVNEYVIDLSQTEYMDSSALGMLLILKEYADSGSASVRIINCNNDVNKILSVSDFENLFEIA